MSYFNAKNRQASAAAMNESTVWSRVISPLLLLAEAQDVKAWSQVPIGAVLVATLRRALASVGRPSVCIDA